MLDSLVGEDNVFIGSPVWLGEERNSIDLGLEGWDGSPEVEGIAGLNVACCCGACSARRLEGAGSLSGSTEHWLSCRMVSS